MRTTGTRERPSRVRAPGRAPRHRWGLGAAALLVAAGLLAGCGGADSAGSPDSAASAPEVAQDRAPAADSAADGGTAEESLGTSATATAADREIIRTADISVLVDDVTGAADEAIGVVKAAGGTLTYEVRYSVGGGVTPMPVPEDGSTSGASPAYGSYGLRADLTFRVPPDKLDSVVASLGELGTVEQRSQQASDVTEQVADIDSRVASLEASVARLRTLLDRAESVADVAAIEAELTKRESELESLQAQQRSLADQVAQATVSVHLYDAEASGETEPGGFIGGLQAGWDAFVTALGWVLTALGALLPFLAAIALPLLGLVWLMRRRRQGSGPTGPGSGPAGDLVDQVDQAP